MAITADRGVALAEAVILLVAVVYVVDAFAGVAPGALAAVFDTAFFVFALAIVALFVSIEAVTSTG